LRKKEIDSLRSKATSMDELVANAGRAERDFESKQVVARSASELAAVFGRNDTFADNSRRQYFREFKKLVDAADVILEVLDARDPLGCRCVDIEERIMAESADKRIVFVLNKIDLVPHENVVAWLKYLRRFHPTVAFKCSTQQQQRARSQMAVPVELATEAQLRSADCLGADVLLQLLKNYARVRDTKKMITVGVIGLPNVGKSSLLNSLKRERAAAVGATPGVTKTTQTIKLDSNITLMDCPGIVFASGNSDDIALRNCVRVESLADPISPIGSILRRCPAPQLRAFYGIPMFRSATDFLVLIAQRRGKLRPGGVPDLEAAARQVLNDWNDGSIKYHTEPPAVEGDGDSAALVSSFAEAFNIDSLERATTLARLDAVPASSVESMLVKAEAPPTTDFLMPDAEVDGVDEDDDDDAQAVNDGKLTKDVGRAYLANSANKTAHAKAVASAFGGANVGGDLTKAQKARGREKLAAQIDGAEDAPFSFADDFFSRRTDIIDVGDGDEDGIIDIDGDDDDDDDGEEEDGDDDDDDDDDPDDDDDDLIDA
jgi:nuclear GTP-binding protein